MNIITTLKRASLLSVAVMCGFAVNAQTFTVDGIKYKASGATVAVQKDAYTGDLVIPETVDYEGKKDSESIKELRELSLDMLCKMIVDDNGENYLTAEALNELPANLVQRIDKVVSDYIFNKTKSDNVEDLKKN
mgnify:CR=1 FL=1